MNVLLVGESYFPKIVEVSREGFQDTRLAPDVKME